MKKLRIGVFMGGKSVEREVSFNSGRTVCDHLDVEQYDIIPLFQSRIGTLYILPWHFLHRGKISDFEHRLDSEAKKILWDTLKSFIDFVYIAAHGRFAEDGTLQGILELLKIPYLGSKVLSSALSMDKIIQKDILAIEKIKTPASITIYPYELETYNNDIDKLYEQLKNQNLDFPLIIKPNKSGSSLGITIANNAESLLESIKLAIHVESNEQQAVLLEEYISGLEFTCIIITDYKTGELIALPPTEIVPEAKSTFFDYKQKYMPGYATKYTPARCSQEIIKKIQDTCIKVMKALDILTIARIDGFVTSDNTVVITDPNTLAGMAPSSFIFRQAAEIGMNHTAFINHLITTELMYYTMLTKHTANNNKNNNNPKIKVAVIMGGNSHEKEISLESGRNILYKLSPLKYDARPLFLGSELNLYHINERLLVRNSTKEIELGLDKSMKIAWDDLPSNFDFVFIGLHGGAGENGHVQSMLEMLKLPYNGSSVLTSSLCMNKYKTNQFLQHKGFDVPKSILISFKKENNYDTITADIIKNLNFPLIVKPHDDGCSFFVQKATNKQELSQALLTLAHHNKTDALVEEFIKGIELTVGVIGNNYCYALCPSQVVAHNEILSIEEKFLPGAGENQTPAPLLPHTQKFIRTTMAAGYKALGCKGYARIDCFYQDANQSPTGIERILFLEVNTLPALTPATCIFHQAAEADIKPMEFIDIIIELGLQEHNMSYIPKLNAKINNILTL